MKKYHLYLWIIALVGLMTSCSQDETDALQTANESNRVTLTASLPADFVQPQPKSRALPTTPADHRLRCILEIWSTEASPALKVRQEICPAADASQIDFSFELTTAGTYKALLWADYITTYDEASQKDIAGLTGVTSYGDRYYTITNGLKAVAHSGLYPQLSDAWDAFCASAEFTKAETALTIPTVTLTRPLMKLIIAEKNTERFASCESLGDITLTASYQVPSTFDVATGTASGTKASGIIGGSGWLGFGTDITIGGQTCKTLFTAYVLAGATDGTMSDIVLKFTARDNTKLLPDVTIPAGIPVKRNHRINAAGNLIGEPSSDAVTMTVDINSDWTEQEEEQNLDVLAAKTLLDKCKTAGSGDNAEDYHYTITTAEQLAALSALAQAQTVITGSTEAQYRNANYVLDADINLENKPWTPIYNFYGTFDGRDHAVRNMNVSINSTGNREVRAGLFATLGGKVSNLIVEGTVTVNGAMSCYAGGICGLVAGTIEFCRFNGTVSSTTSNNNLPNTAGGITGCYAGIPTITGCIANATATISGGDPDESGAGGLVGIISGTKCTFSAWNSDSNNGGTSDMIGKNKQTDGSVGTGNNGFTDISGLNNLLSGINGGVSGSTYTWEAGAQDTDYPVLKPRK